MTINWVLVDCIVQAASMLIMLFLACKVARRYKLQFFVAAATFGFYAYIYLDNMEGIISYNGIVDYLRPISVLMPLQIVGMAAIIVALLSDKHSSKQNQEHLT